VVEGDLLLAVLPALAAEDRVLLALLVARVVEVAALRVRRLGIVLLQASERFLVERLRQPRQRLERRGRVRVLGPQVLDDLRVLPLAEPEVIIDARLAVLDDRLRLLRRDGRPQSGFGAEEGDRTQEDEQPESASQHSETSRLEE
jgi:hypothetical protein